MANYSNILSRWAGCCLMVLLLAGLSSATLISKGLSVYLNGVDYYISPYSAGNVTVDASLLSPSESVYGFYPVTVVQEQVALSALPELISNYMQKDDVFQEAFLQAVFLAGATTSQVTSFEGVKSTVIALDSEAVPSGPYFLEATTGSLYMVYRLYSDNAGAFTQGLLQTPTGAFQYLSAQVAGSADLTVGVPSRLYYTPTKDKPLAGVRVGIKDIYNLAGVKKADGNRAYYNLYPAANSSAVPVQRLVDAGAIIVGHQKTSQFANGETATADWVDYLEPFNPRGDGYQDTSSSSAGAGASIGSYPWLDIALGSDTGGSIRGPAGAQGLFGNRPSWGLVSLDGVMPLSPVMDTAGFEVRDPYLWDTANSVMYGTNYTSMSTTVAPTYATKIWTLGFSANASSSPTAAIYIAFLNQISSFFATNLTTLNFTSEWLATGPTNISSNINTFLNTTYPTLISKQQTALVRDPFYADYAAIHDGRTPFIDPAPLARWGYGDSLPASALDTALYQKSTFANWFNTHILPSTSCSSGLLFYPSVTSPGTSPRNKYLSPPSVPFGFSSGRISVFAGNPDFVFPIGQVGVYSNITSHVEYYPVTVDVLAPTGCDGLLVRLAQDLVKAGIVKEPMTGGTIYGGEILTKRSEKVRYVG